MCRNSWAKGRNTTAATGLCAMLHGPQLEGVLGSSQMEAVGGGLRSFRGVGLTVATAELPPKEKITMLQN